MLETHETETVRQTTFSKDGIVETEIVVPRTKRDSEKAAQAQAQAILTEAKATRLSAKAFLAELEIAPKPTNRLFSTTSGVDFWIRPFSGMDVMALAMTMYREPSVDGDAPLEVKMEKAQYPEFMVQCLHTFLVGGEDDSTPLFASAEAARAFVYHPSVGTEAIEVSTAIVQALPNFTDLFLMA